MLQDKVTVPEKPLRLVNVIVELFVLPWGMGRVAGLAEILKSATLIVVRNM